MEALQEQLGGLLRERELLRATGNDLALERNRRDIGSCQRDLSAALIALYCANSSFAVARPPRGVRAGT